MPTEFNAYNRNFDSPATHYSPRFHVDAPNVIAELNNHILADGFKPIVDLAHSKGSYLTDKVTGKRYLDMFTCIASMPIGWNHPKMTDPAFLHYLAQAAINKPSNSDLYSEEMAAFVKTFFKIAVPDHFKYGFFIEGGALAVENALKTAIDWKVRQNFRKGIQTERGHQIMHFRQAFHGRSGYTMSLTNTDPTKTALYPKFDWPRIHNPAVRFPLDTANLEQVIREENIAVEQMKAAFAANPDHIAAIILEPIQGEGGDNHFRHEFMQTLRNIADENDALLIFDEVQTGMGISGEMWAHQAIGVNPDIISFGKKSQVCGILVGDRIDNEPEHVFRVSSRINSTWGGNLTDMVRVARYLEIIDEERLVDNARNMGQLLQSTLQKLGEDYPDTVSNARGLGLFCAFDLPSADIRAKFLNKSFEQGLMIWICGERSVRFRPPLNISASEIQEADSIIRNILNDLKNA
ncbi:L-lysine 6-transaminase [Ignavibacteria bacterium]|nr:L-lysine 6-transaminase [Bacteroidota bacterium]MCZ2131601.1 L-lysine 6-transaminase [Bacteroidota bacterium]